jgi:hypothetical protein
MYFTGIRDMVNILMTVMYFTGIRDMINYHVSNTCKIHDRVISKLIMSLIPVKYMTVISKLTMSLIPVKYMTES